MVLRSPHSLSVGQKWDRLCNHIGLDMEAFVPIGWTLVTQLLWITMVSPTILILILACSVPNFNTVIHNNGKKRCSQKTFFTAPLSPIQLPNLQNLQATQTPLDSSSFIPLCSKQLRIAPSAHQILFHFKLWNHFLVVSKKDERSFHSSKHVPIHAGYQLWSLNINQLCPIIPGTSILGNPAYILSMGL